MKNENDKEKDNQKHFLKAKLFQYKDKMVHISKKSNNGKTFIYNGTIIEVGEDYILLDDREEGERLILFSELAKDIEEYKEKK